MIGHINSNKIGHIVTIKGPIEFLHSGNRCLINQREVGINTESLTDALRSALRQYPDVIVVGEMRDLNTISTAIVAAETDHLVLSTLHTIDAIETIHCIITIFPPYQQQIRLQLTSLLRRVILMRLISWADGKERVPAVEVMVTIATIRKCIADADKTRKIPEVTEAGRRSMGCRHSSIAHEACTSGAW